MTLPWYGAARGADAADFIRAAERIGCDVAAIRAVWQKEAAGAPYRPDGSVERRFEPHKLPVPDGNYKTSMKLGRSERERKFAAAYANDAESALCATSWGGPQIMGFNHSGAGFGSARDMVAAMAESEARQIEAFVSLVIFMGLDGALRAHDWQRFARRYNGNANVQSYAAGLEKIYRGLSGAASPAVLRSGDKGAGVRQLQAALGIEVDGSFGPATLEAVKEAQRAAAIPIDGVVGQRTWDALGRDKPVSPAVQPSSGDVLSLSIAKIGAAGTALGTTAAGAKELAQAVSVLPQTATIILVAGAAVCAVIALCGLIYLRRAAL
jgi:hypothetical protein